MRTGLVFPGSVPFCGWRFASQIVPWLIAGLMFPLPEFRIDPHAFLAYSPAELHDPGPSPVFFDFAVHRQDGLAQVGGARHIQIFRDLIHFAQDVIGETNGNRSHVRTPPCITNGYANMEYET